MDPIFSFARNWTSAKMASRLVLLSYILIHLVTGSGVNFVEDDIFLRLRSDGHVTAGYIPDMTDELDPDHFQDRLTLAFTQLRFITPSDIELYHLETRSELFDIQQSAFHKFADLNVHAMSMKAEVFVLGVTLDIKGIIFKEDSELTLDDDTTINVYQGEILVSVEVLPVNDLDIDCIACQVDDGHVMQLGFDVTHVGDEGSNDLTIHPGDMFHSVGYADDSILNIPKQVLVDDEMRNVNVTVSRAGNLNNIIVRLPAPLGDRLELNFLLKVKEPTVQLVTTSSPEPETTPAKTPRTPSISVEYVPRDTPRPHNTQGDEGSREHVNVVEDDESEMIQVKSTTTMKTSTLGKNSVKPVKNNVYTGSQTKHTSSVLLLFLTLFLCMYL